MSSRRSVRQLLVAVLLGVLVGGGLMAVTPAGAEVAEVAATRWKKIWKKELKPLAAKTFYTKKQADTKYASKTEAAAGAAAAQGAANAATDSKLGGYYKKAETDAKYVAKPVVQRGMFGTVYQADAANAWGSAPIQFATPLAAAPTVRYIQPGDPMPVGCSGSAAAPGASAGYLCIFERYSLNRDFVGVYGSTGLAPVDGLGAYIGYRGVAAGAVSVAGTWALGVSTPLGTASRVTVGTAAPAAGPASGR